MFVSKSGKLSIVETDLNADAFAPKVGSSGSGTTATPSASTSSGTWSNYLCWTHWNGYEICGHMLEDPGCEGAWEDEAAENCKKTGGTPTCFFYLGGPQDGKIGTECVKSASDLGTGDGSIGGDWV